MGFLELLTIIFIVLKVLGIITWSWGLVLLPFFIALGIYALIFALISLGFIQSFRAIRKISKEMNNDKF